MPLGKVFFFFFTIQLYLPWLLNMFQISELTRQISNSELDLDSILIWTNADMDLDDQMS